METSVVVIGQGGLPRPFKGAHLQPDDRNRYRISDIELARALPMASEARLMEQALDAAGVPAPSWFISAASLRGRAA